MGKSIPAKGKRPGVVTEWVCLERQRSQVKSGLEEFSSLARAARAPGWGRCCVWVGGGCPAGSLSCWQQFQPARPLPPPVSRPPLPSSAQTTEAFQRKLLLILAAIPGHPHPQPPLRLGPCRGPKSLSESRPEALGVRSRATSRPAADPGAPASELGDLVRGQLQH